MTRDAVGGDRAVSTKADRAALRARIATQAAEVGTAGEPGYPHAAERLVATAVELVGAEELARERKLTKRRRSNKTGAVISGLVLGAESAWLGIASMAGFFSPYWLLLVTPMLVLSVIMLSAGVDSETDTTKQHYPSPWPASIGALGADATLALVVDHVLAGGFSALAAVLGLMAAGGFFPDAKKTEGEPAELEAASAGDSTVNDAVPARLPVSEPSDAPMRADQDRSQDQSRDRDEAQDQEVRGLVRQVRNLEGQIASLSSVIARTGLAPGADLKLAGPEKSLLVSQITQGRQARNGLLSAPERAAYLTVLTEAGESKQDYLDTLARAVKAAELLGRTRARAAEYATASKALLEVSNEIKLAKPAHDNLTTQAELCVEELKTDDRAARELAGVLEPSDAAHRELLGIFRARLRREIEHGALLPAWLIASVGPTPPTRSPEPWYEVAARVLAHRTIYEVHADDSALGPRPSTGTDHVRLTEFNRLNETLRLREWSD